jgi:hypothetical protein
MEPSAMIYGYHPLRLKRIHWMQMHKAIIAGAMGLLMAVSAVMPATAMPIAQPLGGHTAPQVSEAEQIQYRRHRPGYWNGHYGYRGYHRGYRRHNDGYWYPLAAFGAGAIIGGAIASQPRRPAYAGINPQHYDWCASRYRTYRASDNTYAPRVGVRAVCTSPYY